REKSYVPPPSKWTTIPRDVKGRTKNFVSETVLASPALPNGVKESILWLKRFVQSAVARPVVKPWLLSPVGAVNSSVELYFSSSPPTSRRPPRNALPIPFTNPLPVDAVPVVGAVDDILTK